MTPLPALGLVLLTGGRGRRLGGPKHARPHREGRSWGGHLVSLFASKAPEGPVQLLGEGLPDRPDLPALPDEGLGPAAALIRWAGLPGPAAARWWVVACDQVRWTEALLGDWLAQVGEADPSGETWVVGEALGHLQPLGGVLPEALRKALAASREERLGALVRSLPHRVLAWDSPAWRDVDTPGDLEAWAGGVDGIQGKPTAR